jgi:hypothetical protein
MAVTVAAKVTALVTAEGAGAGPGEEQPRGRELDEAAAGPEAHA